MRSILFSITLGVLALGWIPAVKAAANGDLIDGVAAVVNDKVITYSDVRDYVSPIIAQLRRNYSGTNLVEKIRSAQMDGLNNLIERNLILQEFKEKGYSFPETVVDGELNDVIVNDFAGDRAAFIKTLQAENMTLTRYREQLRDRIIVQAMRNRKTQNEVVVSPYKIDTYYKEHDADYRVEDQIKLRMIFIKKTKEPETAGTPPPAVSNATEQAASAVTNATPVALTPANDARRRLAGEIHDKLDNGDSFQSLAKLYSEGKEKEEGGEWGWVKRDELRADLSEPAFKLKTGQHSQIIETTDGYYILQVDDVRPAHTRPLPEVRAEIERILLQQQRAKMQDAWVKQLRAKAYIRLY